MLLNGDEVGEGLKGVYSGRFHGEYGTAGIFDKLIQHRFCIVIFTVSEAGKRAHTNEVTVAAHHGNGFQ